jgi:hypothetical protein
VNVASQCWNFDERGIAGYTTVTLCSENACGGGVVANRPVMQGLLPQAASFFFGLNYGRFRL